MATISKRETNPGGLETTQNAGAIWELRWNPVQPSTVRRQIREGVEYLRIEEMSTESFSGEVWDIEVEGDHSFRAFGVNVHNCGCKWGAYHWGASDDFSRFAGRMCSHALALQFEAQSRGMFGNVVEIDKTRPDWVPPRVVVKYNPDSGKNTMVRSSSKHDPELSPLQIFCAHAGNQGDTWDAVTLLLRTSNMLGQQALFPEPEHEEVKKDEPVWYHGTRHELQPGDHIEPGRKSNQGYGQPNDKVFFSSRPEIAAFFAHAGEGPEDDYDARPRVYRVKTTGPWEPDKDEEWQTGSHQSRHPVQVEAEEPWSPRWTKFISQGAVNSPWGEPSVETPAKPYGATSPPNPYQSPASAGFLTAPDPDSWSQLDPSGMSITTTLHPEPEAALPSTDGELEEGDLDPENPSIMTMGNQVGGNDEIMDDARPTGDEDIVSQFQNTAAAQALMGGGGAGYSDGDIALSARTALKAFSPAEQQALINEGMDVRASNLDRLDIAGTHYSELDDDEGDSGWLS